MAESSDLKDAWTARVLGVDVSQSSASGEPEPPASVRDGPSMRLWQTERAKAVANLRALSAEIVKSQDAEARDAVILLQAIIKNLTPMPESGQSVAELQRYIEQDDIIDDAEAENPFGIDLKLRAALLPALAGLQKEYAAAGK
jgi:hypothetical protein